MAWYHRRYVFEDFKEVRNRSRRAYDVLISWVGFPGEDTWEDLKIPATDVPTRLIEFLNSTDSQDSAAQAALNLTRELVETT